MSYKLTKGLRVAVLGASIGGLSCANVMKRVGANAEVFCPLSSSTWARGGHTYTDTRCRTNGSEADENKLALVQQIRGTLELPPTDLSMARDLWRFLYEGLPKDTVHFGVDVLPSSMMRSMSGPAAQLHIMGEDRHFDLIVAADGNPPPVVAQSITMSSSHNGVATVMAMVDAVVLGEALSSAETLEEALDLYQRATYRKLCENEHNMGEDH